MVKITLSFVAMAAMVASVAAYPFQERPMSRLHSSNECIPGVSVREYHPFYMQSRKYKGYISQKFDDEFISIGYSGDKGDEALELCVVSSDLGCVPDMHSNCIYENVEYRFRVNSPVKGYLKVVGDEVEIVDSFNEASGLNLYMINSNAGLRISHLEHGLPLVFQAHGDRRITLTPPVAHETSQWFTIQKSTRLQHSTCRDW